ncbi:MAG: hypothetical protein NDI60_01430 [Elusimicrobiales bacterium]|nr:hypothetical protein [Elusimicrobiales bacterium]
MLSFRNTALPVAAIFLLAGLCSDAAAGPRPKLRVKKSFQTETAPASSTATARGGGDSSNPVGGAGLRGSSWMTTSGSLSSGGASGGGSSSGGGGGSRSMGGGGGSAGGGNSSGGGSAHNSGGGKPAGAAKVVFSTTQNGPAKNSFSNTQLIYGKVSGLGGDSVYSCACPKLSDGCDDRSAWTQLPNNEWSYNPSDKTWRMASALNGIPPGYYKLAFEDRNSGASTGYVDLQLTPPAGTSCRWNSPDAVIGPCDGPYVSGQRLNCSASNNGQFVNTSGTGDSCQARWTCNCN